MHKREIWQGPSETEKKEGVSLVRYETDMLTASYNKLSIAGLECSIKNMALESFLVHVRALLEFFEKDHSKRYITNKRSDHTVISQDFGYGPLKLSEIDDLTRKRLNKDLAHIDYARVQRKTQAGGKGWNVISLNETLRQRLDDFFQHVNNTQN